MKSCSAAAPDAVKKQDTIGDAMLRSLAEGAEQELSSLFMPGIAFAMENGRGSGLFLQEQIAALFPFYGYYRKDNGTEDGDDRTDFRTIMLAEAEEGTYPEEAVSEDAERISSTDPVQDEGQASGEADLSQESMQELLRAENEAAAVQQPAAFIPHTRQNQVDLEALSSYETLISQFYTIDANTTAGSDQLNVSKLLGTDMSITKDGDGPQILIYHTHSQEAFADSIPGDATTSIMGVGEHLAEILRDTYGYNVVHHLGQYDKESRDDSYSVALSDIAQVLDDYPSIEVVIDLHRDAMPESTHLVMDLDGRPTARFMFFNGLSRTKKTGNIAYLYNENLDGNLAFSFQLQRKAMEYYPNLTRKIYLKGYRYNMHLKPRCLLIELGAQNNTVEEAMNACDPLAHILDLVLSGESQ
ncbi:MAG: stage II sporulation protein P [Lachnospiraceae bacterium]|nr:stage II sporulation protein P [Lachnospiraceae bacterium]